jgi:hypothetical protein
MKIFLVILVLGACALTLQAQQSSKGQAPPQQPPTPATAQPIETEKVEVPGSSPAPQGTAREAGYLEPSQLKKLLHNLGLVEYRVNDLLSDAHPERWKISDKTRSSFAETLANLHKALESLEEWRSQFEKRTDSIYFGFQSYAAINAVLPRLDAVGRAVSQYENRSLAGQYGDAESQLFDLQQSLQPYIAYLLRNPDELLYAAQNNLASCQRQLGVAMHGHVQPATPMKNVLPAFKGHPRVHRNTERSVLNQEKPVEKRHEKKSAKKPPESAKSSKASAAAKPRDSK